ncbi:hypothetical protein [Nitrososphaera sp. AFS]|uniref:hypothetical protein n=1 Tax=Nitrososphaera sp. AFS TaxID=2301191 RepID=UPI001392422C|nr:hypothetical protein [Nitrososphaera sp. AFS]NAL78022.1 hypothetical protein [Nitrososphaera sp. AFS]
MGINSVEYDKFQYQSILETTYFWTSKGGRGTLLESVIASLGNSYSDSNIPSRNKAFALAGGPT